MYLSHLDTSFKLCPSRNQALTFADIHKQQFPLLHYCVTGSLPSVALVAQTNVTGCGSSAQQFSPTQRTLLQFFHLELDGPSTTR